MTSAEWNRDHPEVIRAASRKWHAANPEKARAARHAWYNANKARVQATNREWRKKHPDAYRAKRKRRGRPMKLKWLLRKRPELKAICVIGGGIAKHADHIQPVSHGGQRKDPANMRPLCARHNLMRGAARFTDSELAKVPCS
jgi:hypothetical protein